MRLPDWTRRLVAGSASLPQPTVSAVDEVADTPWAPLLTSVAEADRVLDRFDTAGDRTDADRLTAVRALLAKAKALTGLERSDAALACAERALTLLERVPPSDEAVALRAEASLKRAGRLVKLGRSQEARAQCADVLGLLPQVVGPAQVEFRARALVTDAWAQHKLGDSEAALDALQAVVEQHAGSDQPAVVERVIVAELRIALLLDAAGRAQEARATRDAVIEQYGGNRDPDVREAVSMVLGARAQASGETGDAASALRDLDEVLARIREVAPPSGSPLPENASFLRVGYLYRVGRPPEEVAAERAVWVARFDLSPLRSTQGRVAVLRAALIIKATAGEPAQAVEEWTAWLDRFDVANTPAPQHTIARARFLRAEKLREQQDFARALADFEQVIERYAESAEPQVSLMVRWARVLAVPLLKEAGRLEDALTLARKVVASEGNDTDAEAQENAAKALGAEIELLGRLDRTDEQLSALDELVTRFDQTADADVRKNVVRATAMQVRVFVHNGRVAEAQAISEGLTTRLQWATNEDELLALGDRSFAAATALFNAAQEEAALPAFAALADDVSFTDAEMPELRALAARASLFRVACLAALGREEESAAAAEALDFGPDMLPGLDEIAEATRSNSAMPSHYTASWLAARVDVLRDLGRVDEARAAARDAIERLSADRDPEVAEAVRELSSFMESSDDQES